MSRIRSEKTGPEMRLHGLLTSKGLNDFEMQPKNIFGRPDFYFPNRKTAIFLDGCFWHGCKTCFKIPKTNRKFWKTKIESNMARDGAINKRLTALGIKVIRIKEHHLKENADKVISKIELRLRQDLRPKVLDLFAGAGGFSEGFIAAGCNMVAHIEMDKDACDTIRTRIMYHNLKGLGKLDEYEKYLLGDLEREKLMEKYNLHDDFNSVIRTEINQNNYLDLIMDVGKRLGGKQLDIIIGGPPCQAYSHIGRSSDKKHMIRDTRKHLYKYYIEFLKAFRPKIFVFENVPGLLSAGKGIYLKKMRQLMKEAGYNTDYKILNAADFGVPQERKRVIIIGWNGSSKMETFPEFQKVQRNYGVADFLKDLPKINSGEGVKTQKYFSGNKLLYKLGIINSWVRILTDHISRPQRRIDLEIYKIASENKKNGKDIRYNELPSRLKTHKNQTDFLDRFKVVDKNSLSSHTVIAHIAKDGHYYIHPDSEQNRSLTVREAARLQTFPDDFKFEGSRTSQFRQIGNAVPPMLSKIIAKKIINFI
jgi:DNA (cytosine-5)-methyltransferase 1